MGVLTYVGLGICLYVMPDILKAIRHNCRYFGWLRFGIGSRPGTGLAAPLCFQTVVFSNDWVYRICQGMLFADPAFLYLYALPLSTGISFLLFKPEP